METSPRTVKHSLFDEACRKAGISEDTATSIISEKSGSFRAKLGIDLSTALENGNLVFQNWVDIGAIIRSWGRSWTPSKEMEFCNYYFLVLFRRAVLRKGKDFLHLVDEAIKNREMRDPLTRTLVLADPKAQINEKTLQEKQDQYQTFCLKDVTSGCNMTAPVLPLGEVWRVGAQYHWSWKLSVAGFKGLDYMSLQYLIPEYRGETFSTSLEDFQKFLCALGVIFRLQYIRLSLGTKRTVALGIMES